MRLDNPLLEHLGVRLLAWEPGACRLALPLEPRHLNRQASLQGGMTATLLDAACGYAGLQQQEDGPAAHAVTLSLSINYLARAAEGEVRATGRVTGGGRRVYFASAELHDGQGRLLATAQGAFKRR
ncbi:MAG: PaaI family thioesterase [Ramlibacter sp.]